DGGEVHAVRGGVSCWCSRRGGEGLVVEPQGDLAQLHRRLRPRDRVVQSLIGRDSGERDFYVFDRLHGLSTTIGEHATAAKEQFRTLRLPSMSLAELCRTWDRGAIDFLKIDVEGAEADVIAGADWDRFR